MRKKIAITHPRQKLKAKYNMELAKKIKLCFLNFFRKIGFRFLYVFRRDLSNCKTILDLGCGPDSPVQYCDASFKVGVELFDAYFKGSKEKNIHNQYIKEDVAKVEFEPKSFDAVVIIDVLEHLSKKDGLVLLNKMENWAKKKIIIHTPNGYVYQNGYDNNPYQNHISSWDVKDFEDRGFKVFGMEGFKILRGCRGGIKYKPNIFWKIISDLSQEITYFFPKLAFHLYIIKEL